ncbi:MAG: hypothetical protein P1U42_07300 [Phycisphaerales bacterium]|nr:hypothetical protein [Phycisphaerales bacterium]
MPAVSHAKVPCISQLANELGFASKPTLLRHLDRIDELAPQVDPEGIYPEDWIVFRITGYRPEIESPALIPGEALRGDLSAVAEHISEHAKLSESDIHAPYETINSLASRWNVSRKTIERYRRLGLIARRLDLGSGRRLIIFMQSAVEWFESLNAERLGRAAQFDRIESSKISLFERWAKGYRRHLGWSRSQSAARIALRTGHSHEGVRKALIRIDRESLTPIFNDPKPTSTRDQIFAHRASLRGIEPSEIAKKTARSHNAVLRAINSARMHLLESYKLPTQVDEHLDEEPLLDSPAVNQGLMPRTLTDLFELVAQMRTPEPTVVYSETMRAKAYHLLLQSAGALFHSLDKTTPSAPTLDEIETKLRWAGMLKAELLYSQFNLILQTIEHKIGGPIDTLDPTRASFLLLGSIRVASDAIDRFDPTHSGRIAAPVGLVITRFASHQPDIAQPPSAGKASRRIPPGHIVEDWSRIINPWHQWLMCNPRILKIVEQLDDRDQLILNRRYGIDGSPPASRVDLAGLLDTSTIYTARFERIAIRNAFSIARKQ